VLVSGPPPPIGPSRPTGPDGRENGVMPGKAKKPGVGSKIMRGLMQNLIMLASMVVTYLLTQKFLASSLQSQFGDMGKQIGPAVISLGVGGVARTILGAMMSGR
jgi:hypothetical protein